MDSIKQICGIGFQKRWSGWVDDYITQIDKGN